MLYELEARHFEMQIWPGHGTRKCESRSCVGPSVASAQRVGVTRVITRGSASENKPACIATEIMRQAAGAAQAAPLRRGLTVVHSPTSSDVAQWRSQRGRSLLKSTWW